MDKSRLDLGVGGGDNPGKTLLVKATSAADYAVLRDVYQFGTDPITNEPLIFPTLDSAIGACRASLGDKIYVSPGHAETLTAAAAIALDVAGVSVIGLGTGNNRPVFTFGSTDNSATFTISGNNCSLKNIVAVCNDDGLTNAFVVSGDNCDIDIEFQDTSATVEAATAVRLDTANNVKLKLKYLGFTTGNAVVSAVILDDCDNAEIEIDAYGIVSTAWVEMVDVASTNVRVTGTMYTQGITNFSRDVVDTITGSKWSAEIFDASFGGKVSGGSAAALASDDVSAVGVAIAAIQTDLGDPSARTNLKTIEAMLGNPDTAGATIFAAIGGAAGLPTYPAGAQAANDVSVAEVVRYAQETLRLGTGGTALANNKSIYDALGSDGATVTDVATSVLGAIGANNANNAFDSSSVVANVDGSTLERLEDLVVKVTAVDDILDSEFPVVATAVGAVADAALADTIEGAAAATQSMLADIKGVLQRIGADNANNTAATTLVAANDDGSLLERLEGLKQGIILQRGTFTTSSATVPADTGRTEANDYWNGCYLVPVAGAIAGEPRLIVDFANAGGVFTLDADIPFSAVPGAVAYIIIPGNIQIAPTANSTASTTPAHVVGNKADTVVADTVEGAAATTQSLHALVKAALQRLGADSNDNSAATTLVVSNPDGSILEREEYIQNDILALPRCVEKADGAVLTGNDNLFVITGGPVKATICGVVTVEIGANATNGDLQEVTTAPAATVNLNAAPVAFETDAVGTSYTNVNTTGIFTPTTAGFVLFANSFATNETEYLLPIGTVHFRSSAANTGNIKWYMRYVPLSPLSRVVAAA